MRESKNENKLPPNKPKASLFRSQSQTLPQAKIQTLHKPKPKSCSSVDMSFLSGEETDSLKLPQAINSKNSEGNHEPTDAHFTGIKAAFEKSARFIEGVVFKRSSFRNRAKPNLTNHPGCDEESKASVFFEDDLDYPISLFESESESDSEKDDSGSESRDFILPHSNANLYDNFKRFNLNPAGTEDEYVSLELFNHSESRNSDKKSQRQVSNISRNLSVDTESSLLRRKSSSRSSSLSNQSSPVFMDLSTAFDFDPDRFERKSPIPSVVRKSPAMFESNSILQITRDHHKNQISYHRQASNHRRISSFQSLASLEEYPSGTENSNELDLRDELYHSPLPKTAKPFYRSMSENSLSSIQTYVNTPQVYNKRSTDFGDGLGVQNDQVTARVSHEFERKVSLESVRSVESRISLSLFLGKI
ncbi:hypothetical protein HK096_001215 [Nowakowskiella sp. JEL0078]|nr:hypothetical protein HK096_001215 [Nowakowskiella sp. JEL0078]